MFTGIRFHTVVPSRKRPGTTLSMGDAVDTATRCPLVLDPAASDLHGESARLRAAAR